LDEQKDSNAQTGTKAIQLETHINAWDFHVALCNLHARAFKVDIEALLSVILLDMQGD
jgi:hypothetical protein